MESAIDKHLKCPRTLSRRVHDGYQPPFPMFAGRASDDLTQVVMAYLGVQFREENRENAVRAMQHIVSTFSLSHGPGNHDISFHTDNQGYGNFIVVGYWRDPAAYCRWIRQPEIDRWWASDERLQDGIGYFREIISPRAEQFETLYAFKEDLPGVGAVMDNISGEIQEHGYWGSVRDRIAEKVRSAVARLENLGALIGEVSVPGHQLAAALWSPIGCEGLTMQMMQGNGMGFNWEGLYDVALLDKHAAWRGNADSLSPSLKICMLIGQYGLKHYNGRYYAKAQNLARRARADYDRAFADFDLLVMPTVPMTAQPLPPSGCSITEFISRAFEMIGNTAALDVTGHPAMSVPCGRIDGLPVGMMLISRHFAESTIYQAAAAFEASGDWKQM